MARPKRNVVGSESGHFSWQSRPISSLARTLDPEYDHIEYEITSF